MKGYTHDKTRWRTCHHPRTRANSSASGHGSVTCRTCKRERDQKRYLAGPRDSFARQARRKPILHALPRLVDSWRPLPIPNTSGRSYGGCG